MRQRGGNANENRTRLQLPGPASRQAGRAGPAARGRRSPICATARPASASSANSTPTSAASKRPCGYPVPDGLADRVILRVRNRPASHPWRSWAMAATVALSFRRRHAGIPPARSRRRRQRGDPPCAPRARVLQRTSPCRPGPVQDHTGEFRRHARGADRPGALHETVPGARRHRLACRAADRIRSRHPDPDARSPGRTPA